MPLTSVPVVVPYEVPGHSQTVFTVQVDALASEGQALTEAQALVAAWLQLRHPEGARMLPLRARLGSASSQPEGPFLYVLSPLNHIHSLLLPTRIDNAPGERLGDTLAGLAPGDIHGVVMDCTHLAYINTTGMASLAGHAKRLRLYLHSLPASVQTVFDIVGLNGLLHVHADRSAALRALVADCRAVAARSG